MVKRPKKDPTIVVSVRLTKEELSYIAKEARKHNLNISECIRFLTMGKKTA